VKLILPLKIRLSKAGKKWFILNLNSYRNTHFQTLSTAKKFYALAVQEQLPRRQPHNPIVKLVGPLRLRYKYFAASNRRVDVSNPCSVIDKFTCDALTEAGVLHDDDVKTIVSVEYVWGGVERLNPRCELEISKY
jgi:Holliday junction resolvase RusA-like endonuclease